MCEDGLERGRWRTHAHTDTRTQRAEEDRLGGGGGEQSEGVVERQGACLGG